MREITFKGYLERQMCELSDCKSKSLYKFARLAENNARLKDVLCLYFSFYVNDKLKNQLTKKYKYLSEECRKLSKKSPEDIDDSLSEYKTVYTNYLNQKNSMESTNKIKLLMWKRIVELKTEKGISNYQIYKSLNLNSGNVNAFLKNADVSKVGLDTVRRMLSYLNN